MSEQVQTAELFQLSGVGVVETDMRTGRFRRANAAFCALVGYSEAELRGMTYLELTHPDDQERDAESFAVLQRGEVQEGMSLTRLLRKDGQTVWAELHVTVLGEGSERVNLTVVNDVTERKRQEEALRESEEQQAFLLELSDALRAQPDEPSIKEQTVKMLAEYLRLDRCWISEVSEQQGISTVGPEHLRPGFPPMSGVFRLSDYAETMRQLATQSMVIPDAADDPRFSDSEKELLAGLQLRALLVVPLRKGQRHVIWALAAAVATPRGWTDGERVLLEDVAERTWAAVERARVEAARAASEEKYRTLFESMDEAYAVVEVLADEAGRYNDFRFLEVNPAFIKQTGMDYPVGKRATELLGTPNPRWAEVYGRVAETGEPVRFEQAEGTLGRTFDLYCFRLGDAGSRRVAVLFTDITERKNAEVRQAYLLKLSDILQRLEQPNDLKAAAMRVLGEHLGVSRAQYHEVDSSGEYYDADGVGYANGLPLLNMKYRIGDFGTFVGEDFAAGRPFRSDDLTLDPQPTAEERAAYALYDIRAGAGIPLLRGGKLVAILAVHNVHPHPWTDLEMELVRETAERIWAVVERARAEKALRKSEERLQSIVNLVPDLLWDSEPDGSTTWYNRRWLEYTGQSSKEAAGWGWTDTVHPDDREASVRRYREAFENGELLRQEHRLRRRDGEYRWFVVNAFPLKDESGKVIKVYGAATDIHELRLTNEALRASEERLRLTVEGVRDYAILTLDPERRITSWNPGAERIFGYAEDEALGQCGDILFTPEDREAGVPEQEVRQAREEGRAADERWHLRKDGSRFFVSGVTAPLYEGDRLTGYAKIARDLTEQREAEEQLRGWEERYRIALEAAELATWDWDVGADRVIWNEQHYHLFGLEPTPGAETAESFLRFVHPKDLQDVRGALERALVEGDYRAEFRIVRADDAEERWMSGYGRVVERQGDQATRMTGVMFDTTERKAAEAALQDLNATLEQRVLERTQALEVSEQRFSQAFYVNPIPACMTTLGRETFVEVNDAFLELTGYERGEVQGRTSRELAMWSSPEDHRRTEAAQKGGAGFRNLELQLRTKDGAVKTILMSAEVIRMDGHEGYLKMFYDISERKRTEEQLHRAIQGAMSDASWFSRSLIEQLRRIRAGEQGEEGEAVELSKRERQVLERIAAGMNNDAIAADLGLSAQTVRNYVSNIYDKLGVRSRAEAVVWARERGFVS